MSDPQVAVALRGLQFLQAVSEDLIAKLAEISRVVDFPEGQVVFRQGEPAKSIYLILDGVAALEICASGVGCKRILTVGRGDLLGWSPVLENSRLTATARTLSPLQAIEIDGQKVVEMGEQDPRLGYEFMKRAALALAKRLTATRLQLVDAYGTQMPPTPDERTGTADRMQSSLQADQTLTRN